MGFASANSQDPYVGPPLRRRKLLAADLFCGAGGFTTALLRELHAAGVDVVMTAVNHNQVAIDTHSRNHPNVRHYVEDLHRADPEKLVPEGRLDILLASPTCTYHSRARGGKPTSDQQRMDPEVILKWCTKLRVKRLTVENVPEFMDWGPIDPRNGKPIRSRKGEYFRAWVAYLRAIGFKVEHRILCAADYGDATTRKRFYLLARSDGKPIVWPEPTHSRDGGRDLFGTTQRWRPAREIIDWADRGRSIFWRPRTSKKRPIAPHEPLKPNSLRRVRSGAVKYGDSWAEVFRTVIDEELYRSMVYYGTGTTRVVEVRGKKGKRRRRIMEPGVRVTHEMSELRFVTRNGKLVRDYSHEDRSTSAPLPPLADPYLILLRGTGNVRAADLPVPAITAQGTHLGLAQPFVFLLGQNRNGAAQRADVEPIPTITTVSRIQLVQPFVLGQQAGSVPRAVADPLPTIATGGAISLIQPVAHPSLAVMKGASMCASVDAPAPAITTIPHLALVEPYIVAVAPYRPEMVRRLTIPRSSFLTPYYANGEHLVRSVNEPVATVTTKGRLALVQPELLSFIVPQFGERATQQPRSHSLCEPLPTVTSHGAGALVEPWLVQIDHAGSGGLCVRGVSDPVGTIVTKQNVALAEPFIVHTARGGASARSVDEPIPTITAGGYQHAVVTAADASPGSRLIYVDGNPVLVNVFFRMLRNKELAAAMSFTDDEYTYEFSGTETEITKQIGNAIPVRNGRALVRALLADELTKTKTRPHRKVAA